MIESPDITENYINLHTFNCQHWVSSMLNLNICYIVGMFLIGQKLISAGGLGAYRNMSGKLGMQLAIVYISFAIVLLNIND